MIANIIINLWSEFYSQNHSKNKYLLVISQYQFKVLTVKGEIQKHLSKLICTLKYSSVLMISLKEEQIVGFFLRSVYLFIYYFKGRVTGVGRYRKRSCIH